MPRLPIVFLLAALLVLSAIWWLDGDATGEPAPMHWQGVVLTPAGEPLPDAVVSLRTPNASCLVTEGLSFIADVTDEEGRFALEGPAGEMEIYVEHPDFAPAWRPGIEAQMVTLRPAAWIEMQVPDGATATVSLGMRVFASAGAGPARLGPLPPERPLLVSVESSQAQTQQATFTLTEGETHVHSVSLASGWSVRGRVVPARAGVMLFASQGDARQSKATSAADGSFELSGLEPGRTRIVAVLPEGGVAIKDCDAGATIDMEVK